VFQSAHTYSDNGTYPINVSIVDAGGGQDSGSLASTVVNLPPSVNAGLDRTINTGDTLDFQATFTDPGINDTHTATIDWGDGTNSPGLVTESNGSGTVTGSHTYSIPNSYMVTSTVTDDDGGVGTDTASVEVINQLPVAVCNDVIIIADNNCQGDASVDGGSYDPDENPITIHQSPEGPYGLGLTMATLIVSDSYGASDSCTGTVTVVDTTPPSIVEASASPDLLWPPNHKMFLVNLAVSTSDNCDAPPVCNVLSVTSNEPENASGDGNTAEDWEITGNLAVNLRAECSGNSNGRVYTVELICSDIAGNSSTGAVSVIVPHD
jgi:hypothetical protein